MENNEIQLTPLISAEEQIQPASVLKSTSNRLGISLFVFEIVPVVLSALIAIVCAIFAPDVMNSVYYSWFLQVLCFYLIACPLFFLVLGEKKPIDNAEKKPLSFSGFLFALSVMLFAAVAGTVISNLMMMFVEAMFGFYVPNDFDTLLTSTPLWIVLLVVVILAPIVEELIYRKAFLDRLLPFGEGRAVLFGGLLFGLVHGNFYQFFYAAGAGIVLSYVYARTRNIKYTLYLHMAFNFLGSFLPMLIEKYFPFLEEAPAEAMAEDDFFIGDVLDIFLHLFFSVGYFLVFYGGALVGLILLCVFYQKITLREAAYPLDKETWAKSVFVNPGMLIALVYLAVQLALSFFL